METKEIIFNWVVFFFMFVYIAYNIFCVFMKKKETQRPKSYLELNEQITQKFSDHYCYFLVECGGKFKQVNGLLVYTHVVGVEEITHLSLGFNGKVRDSDLLTALDRIEKKLKNKI